jgi:pyrroline-5-carboxylate reductase
MAEALVRGLLTTKEAQPQHLSLLNRSNTERLHLLRKQYGVEVPEQTGDRKRLLAEADFIVLAMKPIDSEAALVELKALLKPHQTLISVVAGLAIETIDSILEMQIPIVRTMPNTSSTIGLGATGMAFSTAVTKEQQELALSIFRSVGIVEVVEEHMLNMVTALSGSGPAYVYYLMEAMLKAGVEGGLSQETAHELTLQTFLGAAQMVRETGEDPAELRRKVTSPGGTTQAAIEVMDRYNFRDGMEKALFRASERAQEMGAMIGRK